MKRQEIWKRIQRIEAHFGHPMFRTKEAFFRREPMPVILDAIERDQSAYHEIHNEADKMLSNLHSEIKYAKEARK